MRRILLAALFIALILIVMLLAFCPKPNPGKPVPAADPQPPTSIVDTTPHQAQD